MQNILILVNYEKPTSQGYFQAFSESTIIDLKDVCLSPRKNTINTKYRSFQNKILNNLKYLNKILFKFGNVRSSLFSFLCKRKKQLFIYLVNVYVRNVYGIKLRSYFQDILLFQISHRRAPFLVSQALVLIPFY